MKKIFRKYFLSCIAAILGCLAACNDRSYNDHNLKADNMDSIAKKNKDTAKGITGSAGYIYVDDGGTGDIPVVFIHSFGGSTQHWGFQLSHLRHSRRAVAFDIRGHGLSDPPADNDFTVQSMVHDLEAVVNSLNIQRFILVGHSMGGATAIAYAAAHSDRVAGLMLTGTPGKTPEQQSKPVIASLESDKYEKVMEDYMKQLLANARPSVDSLERKGMKKLSKETSISIIKEMFRYDPLPDLAKYNGPKLIVYTSRENQPNALYRQVPWVSSKLVQGTSHWVQLDKPEAFNGIMDEFLNSVK